MKQTNLIRGFRQRAFDSATKRAATKKSTPMLRVLPSPVGMIVLAVTLVVLASFSIFRLAMNDQTDEVILEDGTRELKERIESEATVGADLPGEAQQTVEGPAVPVPGELTVQVTGAVQNPSVVTVKAGARGMDAVLAAGGLTEDADLSSVNLAQLVTDGQHIHVLSESETAVIGPASSGSSAARGCVDLATADSAALQELSGVGEALAARIIAYREQNGISRPEDVKMVSGIGPKTFEGFKDQLCG
ncbi:MAG: helix-hairpin-helix domain-containing protein [Actinomycetaceae bacterium]|nr:helix-hairpin-helix domain-containing protein [Actinomycetaceae bacterium]